MECAEGNSESHSLPPPSSLLLPSLSYQVKHTACVLFRRYLYYMAEPEKSLWQTSNIQIKAMIKQQLLNALTT